MKYLPIFVHEFFYTAFSSFLVSKNSKGFKIIHLPGSVFMEHTWEVFSFTSSGKYAV